VISMAKSSVAKKISSAPAPRIHPELVKEVRKNKPVAKKKPVKVAPKAAAPKSIGEVKLPRQPSVVKRVKLLSIRDASSVIDQIRIAFSVSAIGSLVGIVLGASIPLTTFMIAHNEVKEAWSIYTFLVMGGLVFSAKNVFQWTKAAFRDTYKALGFVALIEGAMIFSHIQWINYLGLGILIAINAIASGANLVIKPVVVTKKPSWV
jgi:hypothetical protein